MISFICNYFWKHCLMVITCDEKIMSKKIIGLGKGREGVILILKDLKKH